MGEILTSLLGIFAIAAVFSWIATGYHDKGVEEVVMKMSLEYDLNKLEDTEINNARIRGEVIKSANKDILKHSAILFCVMVAIAAYSGEFSTNQNEIDRESFDYQAGVEEGFQDGQEYGYEEALHKVRNGEHDDIIYERVRGQIIDGEYDEEVIMRMEDIYSD